MELKDQVVLVTGSSRGLGAAIAKAFGREGSRVIVNYFQNEEKAQQVVNDLLKNKIYINIIDELDPTLIDNNTINITIVTIHKINIIRNNTPGSIDNPIAENNILSIFHSLPILTTLIR